jgi:hypothetical protein
MNPANGLGPVGYTSMVHVDVMMKKVDQLISHREELIAALEYLLARPKCGSCRKVIRVVLERIKGESK